VCGYNKCLSALEFHHIGGHKENNGKIKTVPRLKKEIKSTCLIVVCANCHREIHDGVIEEHTLVGYGLGGGVRRWDPYPAGPLYDTEQHTGDFSDYPEYMRPIGGGWC